MLGRWSSPFLTNGRKDSLDRFGVVDTFSRKTFDHQVEDCRDYFKRWTDVIAAVQRISAEGYTSSPEYYVHIALRTSQEYLRNDHVNAALLTSIKRRMHESGCSWCDFSAVVQAVEQRLTSEVGKLESSGTSWHSDQSWTVRLLMPYTWALICLLVVCERTPLAFEAKINLILNRVRLTVSGNVHTPMTLLAFWKDNVLKPVVELLEREGMS